MGLFCFSFLSLSQAMMAAWQRPLFEPLYRHFIQPLHEERLFLTL